MGFVEVPDFQLLVLHHIAEQVHGVGVVLVDFVEILGHLCRLTAEHAEFTVLFLVQFRVDVDEFEKQVDVVGERHATPLRDGLFYGQHLWRPKGLLPVLLDGIAQVESGAFVRKHHRKFLAGKVVMTLDVVGNALYEAVVGHQCCDFK